MKTKMSIKDGMLTVKGEEDFVDFLKNHITHILQASCAADDFSLEEVLQTLENDKQYFNTFITRCEESYMTVGMFEALGLI